MKFLSLPILFLTTLSLVVSPAIAQSAILTATVRPNPLKVEIPPLGSVPVGKWFEIEVPIFNKGSEAVTKTSAKMHTPSELAVKGKRKRIGTLGPGETTKVIWQAKANHAGNFVIHADVSARLDKETISASASTLVSATDSLLGFWLRFLFERTLEI